jgi:predicted RNase H-like HicB family nuclease
MCQFPVNKEADYLDKLFNLSKNNVIIKNVLSYYRHELGYTYPMLLENLNEILMTLTDSLLNHNEYLEETLKTAIQQSSKSIFFNLKI